MLIFYSQATRNSTAGNSNVDPLIAGPLFQQLCYSLYVIRVGLQNFCHAFLKFLAECLYTWLCVEGSIYFHLKLTLTIVLLIWISFNLPLIYTFKSEDRFWDHQGTLVNSRVRSGIHCSQTNQKPKCPLGVINALTSLCVLNKSSYL